MLEYNGRERCIRRATKRKMFDCYRKLPVFIILQYASGNVSLIKSSFIYIRFTVIHRLVSLETKPEMVLVVSTRIRFGKELRSDMYLR